ncbi:MAG: helix-turn-helix transcriptional regulator [Thalassotalea sp.]|nr:helix-turn-helix transcriptional regulator [Thalassotalea sp.]MDG2392090.1 helix-turn-helix transcriptional regulator [Thalassotalea sp.]
MIVKKLRAENNWSQEQVAVFSGLSIRTIQRVESGQSASLETLKSLASVFEVDISKLTEEIKVIDKKSEHWRAQPLWFRTWGWGVGTRKTHVWVEYIILTIAVIVSIMSYFDPIHAKHAFVCWFVLYFHTVFIRYGDNNQSWGYAT